jgi:Reverse transcriptase (RNA-dependent DNA polymerase)
LTILAVYVDDIVIRSEDREELFSTMTPLSNMLTVNDLGELNLLLGIKIIIHKTAIVINQLMYKDQLGEKFPE